MASEPPAPEGQPESPDDAIRRIDEVSSNEATESQESLPVDFSSPQPHAPPPESWFLRVAFPGIEALLWMCGALAVLVVGTIVGAGVSMLASYIANPQEDFSQLMLSGDVLLASVIGSQIFLLIFGCIGAFLRFGPRFLDRFGLRKLSPAHFLAIVGLTLPLQYFAQCLAVAADQTFKKWGLPDFGESYTQQMQELFDAGSVPLLLLVIAVSPALCEELLFRGLIGTTLVRRWGVVAGVIATSLLFGIIHLIPIQAIAVIPLGIAMHYVYLVTKSFWAPMLLHLCNNSLAVGIVKLTNALEEAPPMEIEAVQPADVLGISAVTIVLLLAVLWQSRKQFRLPDGTIWNPGYVTVESPPPALGATLAGRSPTGITYLLVVLSIASFAALIFFSIPA